MLRPGGMPVEPSIDTISLWAATNFGLHWQRHVVVPAVTAHAALSWLPRCLTELDRVRHSTAD
jgi:hypothetical protein